MRPRDPVSRARQAIDGFRTQFRGLFRRMAAEGGRWHVWGYSGGYVLLIEGAPMDAPLELVLRDVQGLTEDQAAARLWDDSQRRAFV